MADDDADAPKDTRWKKGAGSPNPHGRRGKPRTLDSARWTSPCPSS